MSHGNLKAGLQRNPGKMLKDKTNIVKEDPIVEGRSGVSRQAYSMMMGEEQVREDFLTALGAGNEVDSEWHWQKTSIETQLRKKWHAKWTGLINVVIARGVEKFFLVDVGCGVYGPQGSKREGGREREGAAYSRLVGEELGKALVATLGSSSMSRKSSMRGTSLADIDIVALRIQAFREAVKSQIDNANISGGSSPFQVKDENEKKEG